MMAFYELPVLYGFCISFSIKILIGHKMKQVSFFCLNFFRALKFYNLLIWVINHSEIKTSEHVFDLHRHRWKLAQRIPLSTCGCGV